MITLSREIMLVGFLLLLSLLAGCGTNSPWDLDVNELQVEQEDDSYRMSGEVALGGFFSEVDVYDTRLILTTRDDSVIERIPIGHVDGNSTRSTVGFNESVNAIPQCVFIRYDSIQATSRDSGTITAYLHTEDGYWGFDRGVDSPYESCQAVIDEYHRMLTENRG